MSNRIKLETYTLRIRTMRQKDSYDPLESFGENKSFSDFIFKFLDEIKSEMSVNDKQQRTLQAEKIGIKYFNKNNGIYSGLIESGIFGVASKGVNVDTGETAYTKTTRDADLMPYFFMFYIPNHSKVGALALQRFGGSGISSIFRTKLTTIFNKLGEGSILEINNLIPIQVIKDFIKHGDISELIFRNNMLPSTVEDYLKNKNLKLKEASIHLKVEKNYFLNDDLLKWIDNQDSVFIDIPALKEFGFSDYMLSVMVKKGGSPREIDFTDMMRMRPYYDIHDEVEKDLDTNYPLFESINPIAIQLIKDIFDKETAFINGLKN